MLEEKIDVIKDLMGIQGDNGNWNYSSYMRGLYNGLAIALSALDNSNASFKEEPPFYIEDTLNKRKYLTCA